MRDSQHKSLDDGFNYLLLSDVHLGSDIIPHLRPWALSSWLREESEIDARLTSWLEHYRTERDQGRPWRLIVAGDFLDLVGVSISPPERMHTPPTAEEDRHGLGSAADHVVHKMRAIAARHPGVFRAFGRFVAAGHTLVIVRGNHDIELYWRAAQRALVDAILACEPRTQRAKLRARIAIKPWFFAVDGLLYVEHGHEFDAMCSYGDPLESTCLRDRRRIRWTPFSVLLRYVARPTRGLSSVHYSYAGMGAYVTLLLKLGVRGSLAIAGRYLRASYRLMGECLLNTGKVARARARGAREGLLRFARRSGVHEERLTRLCALYVPPAVQRFSLMLRSLYLDRILSGLSGALALGLAWLLFQYGHLLGAAGSALPALLMVGYALVGSGTNRSPQATMLQRASQIAALFSARWVVMGHTHEPVLQPVSASASYVNLGSWGEDDPPDERVVTGRHFGTFFLLRKHENGFQGELLRWDQRLGALPVGPQTA